jgi:hypothetical protein
VRGPSKLAIARYWLSENTGILGLLIAVVCAAGFATFLVPTGSSIPLTGKIAGFGLVETDTGSYPLAVVRVPAGTIQVPLPRSNNCALGGQLHLTKQRYLLRSSYQAAAPPC